MESAGGFCPLISSGHQTKQHSPGGFKLRHLPLSPGGQKSKIKVSAGLVSGEDCPPGLQTAGFSLCLFLAKSELWSLLYGHHPIGPEPYPTTPFHLNCHPGDQDPSVWLCGEGGT